VWDVVSVACTECMKEWRSWCDTNFISFYEGYVLRNHRYRQGIIHCEP